MVPTTALVTTPIVVPTSVPLLRTNNHHKATYDDMPDDDAVQTDRDDDDVLASIASKPI